MGFASGVVKYLVFLANLIFAVSIFCAFFLNVMEAAVMMSSRRLESYERAGAINRRIWLWNAR